MLHEHLVERRCTACGYTWLLTHEQAKISTRVPRTRNRPVGWRAQIPGQNTGGNLSAGGMDSDVDAVLSARDALRCCPRCQLQDFTDRKVTKEAPPSPDASREALPS